jgi:hypothetical protein
MRGKEVTHKKTDRALNNRKSPLETSQAIQSPYITPRPTRAAAFIGLAYLLRSSKNAVVEDNLAYLEFCASSWTFERARLKNIVSLPRTTFENSQSLFVF